MLRGAASIHDPRPRQRPRMSRGRSRSREPGGSSASGLDSVFVTDVEPGADDEPESSSAFLPVLSPIRERGVDRAPRDRGGASQGSRRGDLPRGPQTYEELHAWPRDQLATMRATFGRNDIDARLNYLGDHKAALDQV
eukprot:3991990-Pyramimonas_sp.AAC.1